MSGIRVNVWRDVENLRTNNAFYFLLLIRKCTKITFFHRRWGAKCPPCGSRETCLVALERNGTVLHDFTGSLTFTVWKAVQQLCVRQLLWTKQIQVTFLGRLPVKQFTKQEKKPSLMVKQFSIKPTRRNRNRLWERKQLCSKTCITPLKY